MAFSHAVVTGAGGFLGDKLCKALFDRGISVVSLDKKPTGPAGCTHFQGPLEQTLPAALEGLRDSGADNVVLFHLAGLADAKACADSPELAWQVNVELVRSVMDTAKTHGVDSVVFPSTGYVYGEDGSFGEKDAPKPVSEYAKTKLAAEAICLEYAEDVAVRIARLSNVYGPESGSNTVVGHLLAQARSGTDLSVWNPEPIRDFIHVDDVVEGLIRIARIPGMEPVVLNLSTGIGTSVREVAEAVSGLTGLEWDESASKSRTHSVMILDNTLLRTMTNWTPSVLMTIGITGCLSIIPTTVPARD